MHFYTFVFVDLFIIISLNFHRGSGLSLIGDSSKIGHSLTAHVRNETMMSLYCLVPGRQNKFNIYLLCPLATNNICKHNCLEMCSGCNLDTNIQCIDHGFDKKTGDYKIQYNIDYNDKSNFGNWRCMYRAIKSNTVEVKSYPRKNRPQQQLPATEKKQNPEVDDSEPPDVEVPVVTRRRKGRRDHVTVPPQTNSKSKEENTRGLVGITDNDLRYDRILTTSQFILTIIALLAISLVCNIIFCTRIIINHCHHKKRHHGNGAVVTAADNDYLAMSQHHQNARSHTPNPSESERIYDDTSFHGGGGGGGGSNTNMALYQHQQQIQHAQRQFSLLGKIQAANGAYVAPTSGYPTLLQHSNYGPSLVSPPATEFYFPLPPDPTAATATTAPATTTTAATPTSSPAYGAFTSASQQPQYTNFVPATTYLSFSSTNTPQPQLQSTEDDTEDENSNKLTTSRVMMEKADNLLRSADSLLKSSGHQISSFH